MEAKLKHRRKDRLSQIVIVSKKGSEVGQVQRVGYGKSEADRVRMSESQAVRAEISSESQNAKESE